MRNIKSNIAFSEEFEASFVPADAGVQTAERVNGRRAFPDRKGLQPRPGETYVVAITGENPKRSVYFLTCKQRVQAQLTLAQSYERATQLLNPPAIVRSFADLGAMVAAKKVEGDDLAIMLRAELHAVVVDHDRTKAGEAEIAELLKSFSKESVADQRLLLAVRRKIEGLKAEKVIIRRDTLSYARLCKLVKAKAERANAGNDEAAMSEASLLQQHAEGVKAYLDAHRQKLAVDMSAAQSELEDLEYSDFFGFFEHRLLRYDPSEALDRLVKVLTDEHNLAEERSGLNGRLIAAISAYENRVAELK